jgi:large subunit ribosomal protein L37Ae
MGNTKKVGTAGRFGARYGVRIRKRLLRVENKAKEPYACPFCGFSRTKREAAGLFVCRKCNAKFTGGAYVPETLVGKSIRKMVSQRTFLADVAVLTKAKESSFADIEKEVEASMGQEKKEEPKKKKKDKKAEAKEAVPSAENEDI